MDDCPCCHHEMVRQIRNHQVRWFCRSCWQDMPLLTAVKPALVTCSIPTYLPKLRYSLLVN